MYKCPFALSVNVLELKISFTTCLNSEIIKGFFRSPLKIFFKKSIFVSLNFPRKNFLFFIFFLSKKRKNKKCLNQIVEVEEEVAEERDAVVVLLVNVEFVVE